MLQHTATTKTFRSIFLLLRFFRLAKHHTYQFTLKIIFTIVTQMTEFQLEMFFFAIFALMFVLTYFVSYVLLNIHMHQLLGSTKLQVL